MRIGTTKIASGLLWSSWLWLGVDRTPDNDAIVGRGSRPTETAVAGCGAQAISVVSNVFGHQDVASDQVLECSLRIAGCLADTFAAHQADLTNALGRGHEPQRGAIVDQQWSDFLRKKPGALQRSPHRCPASAADRRGPSESALLTRRRVRARPWLMLTKY